MALSNEWTEWHLTENGWEEGSNKTDFTKKIKETPENIFLTKRYTEIVTSSFSKLNKNISEIYNNGNGSKIKELIGIFGDCPEHL